LFTPSFSRSSILFFSYAFKNKVENSGRKRRLKANQIDVKVTFFTNALHRENIHVTPAEYIDMVSPISADTNLTGGKNPCTT
jgi:hypothetical protein